MIPSGRRGRHSTFNNYRDIAIFEEQCSVAFDEVETAGHWGFARATVTGRRTSKAGGEVEKVSLKNLWILKRQSDGKWKFWRIMFNRAGPVARLA